MLLPTDTPLKKGCFADLSTDEKLKCNNASHTFCYKCNGNRCNNLGRIDHKCKACTTATNSNCLQNPKILQATRCPALISDDAYCFVSSVMIFFKRLVLQLLMKLTYAIPITSNAQYAQ